MADVKFNVTGAKSMTKRLKQYAQEFPDRVAKALRSEAEIEATEAKKRTPVYVGPTGPGYPIPGLLRDSIHVEGPDTRGEVTTVRIVAGGAAGAYAIPQHENLDYFHEVGQAKYLESVIMESRSHMAGRIAERLRNTNPKWSPQKGEE